MPRKLISILLAVCLLPLSSVQADPLLLPVPGTMVHLSLSSNPAILKGIKVQANDPFRFEFVLDVGEASGEVKGASLPDRQAGTLTKPDIKAESTKLIKYFLAAITTPEKDLWVNLSPYEKDRIVPDSFGQTEMGRDLLAQDYLLKQLTASLIYPEDEIGKKFWKRVYEEAKRQPGDIARNTKTINMNTFNKVWIVPNKAVVYENTKNGTAYVVESSLKVLTEQDYLAAEKGDGYLFSKVEKTSKKVTVPFLEIVIPQLEKEVNEGSNFAQLRQVYNSLILATWYKKKIKDSILSQVYADKNKVKGLEYGAIASNLPAGKAGAKQSDVQFIYNRYLESFKKGAYSFIKEEQDPISRQLIPRKYFSGGLTFLGTTNSMAMTTTKPSQLPNAAMVTVELKRFGTQNEAMEKEFDEAMKADSNLLIAPEQQVRNSLAFSQDVESKIQQVITLLSVPGSQDVKPLLIALINEIFASKQINVESFRGREDALELYRAKLDGLHKERRELERAYQKMLEDIKKGKPFNPKKRFLTVEARNNELIRINKELMYYQMIVAYKFLTVKPYKPGAALTTMVGSLNSNYKLQGELFAKLKLMLVRNWKKEDYQDMSAYNIKINEEDKTVIIYEQEWWNFPTKFKSITADYKKSNTQQALHTVDVMLRSLSENNLQVSALGQELFVGLNLVKDFIVRNPKPSRDNNVILRGTINDLVAKAVSLGLKVTVDHHYKDVRFALRHYVHMFELYAEEIKLLESQERIVLGISKRLDNPVFFEENKALLLEIFDSMKRGRVFEKRNIARFVSEALKVYVNENPSINAVREELRKTLKEYDRRLRAIDDIVRVNVNRYNALFSYYVGTTDKDFDSIWDKAMSVVGEIKKYSFQDAQDHLKSLMASITKEEKQRKAGILGIYRVNLKGEILMNAVVQTEFIAHDDLMVHPNKKVNPQGRLESEWLSFYLGVDGQGNIQQITIFSPTVEKPINGYSLFMKRFLEYEDNGADIATRRLALNYTDESYIADIHKEIIEGLRLFSGLIKDPQKVNVRFTIPSKPDFIDRPLSSFSRLMDTAMLSISSENSFDKPSHSLIEVVLLLENKLKLGLSYEERWGYRISLVKIIAKLYSKLKSENLQPSLIFFESLLDAKSPYFEKNSDVRKEIEKQIQNLKAENTIVSANEDVSKAIQSLYHDFDDQSASDYFSSLQELQPSERQNSVYAFIKENGFEFLSSNPYILFLMFNRDKVDFNHLRKFTASFKEEAFEKIPDVDLYLQMAIMMEIILPEKGLKYVEGLLKSNGGYAPVVRFLDAKKSLLMDYSVWGAIGSLLKAMESDFHVLSRKNFTVDMTAFFKFMDVVASFIDIGKGDLVRELLKQAKTSESIKAVSDQLEYAFLDELAKFLNIESNVSLNAKAKIYMSYLPRLVDAVKFLQRDKPWKVDRFKAFIKAMLEDRFWRFIEDVNQVDIHGQKIALHNQVIRMLIGEKGINIDRWLGKSQEYRLNAEKINFAKRSFLLRPIWRNPGQDIFLGDFTHCSVGMSSQREPDGMMDRLIDEGINVIELIDEHSHRPVAVAWLYLVEDGSVVIQNLEIHDDYKAVDGLMDFIGNALIDYTKKFSKHIGAKRLLMGDARHGKYLGDGGFIDNNYGKNKVSFSMEKIGGYIGGKYYLSSAGKPEAFLIEDFSVAPGGIDLKADKMTLETKNSGGIKFNIDPAMLAKFKNAQGFSPVIINIQPLSNLTVFLDGLSMTP